MKFLKNACVFVFCISMIAGNATLVGAQESIQQVETTTSESLNDGTGTANGDADTGNTADSSAQGSATENGLDESTETESMTSGTVLMESVTDEETETDLEMEDAEDDIEAQSETDDSDEMIESMSEDIVFEQAGEDAPAGMKLNLLAEPYGVTKESLSFSWTDASVNGMQSQSAYRIVISERQSDVQTGQYLYDTGWVESSENTSVYYDLSSVLSDNSLYYWQVQIQNESGTASSLSEPQAFTTAVGSGWSSKTGIWGGTNEKIVMMRQEIERPENVEKAVVSVTAASSETTNQYVYNLYVNGEEIGVGPTRQDHTVLYYHSYDITDFLAVGSNVVSAVNYAESGAGFLCQITYYYTDGTQEIISNSGDSASSWKVMDADAVYIGSDTASIGTTYYTAKKDNLNATVYPDGWQETGYSESSAWSVPSKTNSLDGYTLEPAQMNTVKRHEVTPQSVRSLGNGAYLIDFGKEIVGSLKLTVNASASVITLEYGEQLSSDTEVKYELLTGNVYQEEWTLKSGRQSLSGIGMKTFRYVKITGLSSSLSADMVRGLALRQEFDEDASDFTSSNSVLNDLYDLMKYTSKTTTQDVYVDTQSRERKPYEGDALITAMTSYSFSENSVSASATAEYLLNNTTWPAEYSLYNIMLVYENYMYTGDTRNLETSYQLLKEKTLESYYDSTVGLMKKVSGGSVAGQRIMTDWPASEIDNYNTSDAYYNTVFNAVCVGGYEDMALLAEALGYESDSQYYQQLADTIRKNMIQKLYNADTGEFYDGLDENGSVVEHSAQHATAFALAFGIYTDQQMADAMYGAIEDDKEVKMSIYGAYFLLQGLYRSNHGDLAREIMSNSEDILGVRSWGYVMYGLDATITPEAWNSEYKSNMSLCHSWGSAPGSMLIRGMFGIQPITAGFDMFQIKLQPGGVESASVKVPTMKGTIEAAYTLNGKGGISGTITVPSNAECIFYVPTALSGGTIYINGNSAQTSYEDGYLSCRLSSGTFTFSANVGIYPDESEWLKTDAVYSTWTDGSWTEEVTNGISSGQTLGTKLEALNVTIRNQDVSGTVEYAAYMQTYGWQSWVSAGSTSGLPNSGKRMEAVKIRLTGNLAKNYDIYYRTYVEGIGWLDWAKNGEKAGTSGYSKEMSSIQIKIVPKGDDAPGETGESYRSNDKILTYSTHVQTYGWLKSVSEGETSGTTGEGKRLEAICIQVSNTDVSGGITYCTHVQTYGWQDWKSDGEIAGTSGEAKRLEAIKIKLTGELAEKYDVYYRVHCQTYGWMGWAKNGEPAGSEGYGKRLEAIQIQLVKKGEAAPGSTENAFRKAVIKYRTHVQTYGWQDYVYNGVVSGTSGESKRLEAIQIQKVDTDLSGSIQYRTHIQTYGWESGWKSNGQISGTSGEAKRLEAIQIRLTGELAKTYDIYYRVHCQTYGWLGWAKNGESAGTEGLAKRLEAIEIVLVKKNGDAPGSTDGAFVKAK